MTLFETNFSCQYSRVAFLSMVSELNSKSVKREMRHIAFIDGDSPDVVTILNIIKKIQNTNRKVYVITLIEKDCSFPILIKNFSDVIVDKKTRYEDLKSLVCSLVNARPKQLDNILTDIGGSHFRSSEKEGQVVRLLMAGYTQTQIAEMLHISIKTVSGYKVRSVKKNGLRNFNELCLMKQNAIFFAKNR